VVSLDGGASDVFWGTNPDAGQLGGCPAQIGQGAKIASTRTVKTISSSMCVSLSTTNPLGIKDEIRQLDGMMLILLEKHQITRNRM
jgi:hypothetical protein